jgi:hypothetical protein
VVAHAQPCDAHLDGRRNVGRLCLNRDCGELLVDQGVPGGLPHQRDRDLDVHLLAPADHEQVHVLVLAANRIPLDGLGQRQFAATVQFQGEQNVRAAAPDRVRELTSRQGDVPWRQSMAVQHGRDLARPAGAASAALAELGAGLGGDTDLGHGGALPCDCSAATRYAAAMWAVAAGRGRTTTASMTAAVTAALAGQPRQRTGRPARGQTDAPRTERPPKPSGDDSLSRRRR